MLCLMFAPLQSIITFLTLGLSPSCTFLYIGQRIFSTRLCPLPAPPPSPMIFPGLSSSVLLQSSSSLSSLKNTMQHLVGSSILLYPCSTWPSHRCLLFLMIHSISTDIQYM